MNKIDKGALLIATFVTLGVLSFLAIFALLMAFVPMAIPILAVLLILGLIFYGTYETTKDRKRD